MVLRRNRTYILAVRATIVMLVTAFCMVALPTGASAQVNPLPTSEAALLGRFARGPIDLPVLIGSTEFDSMFGSTAPASWPAEVQARQFFANGGAALHVVRVTDDGPLGDALAGHAADRSGLHALEPLSDLRVLIAPELSLLSAASFAATFASFRAFLEPRRIFFVLDPPSGLVSAAAVINWMNASVPADASFCALYFPYLDVLLDGAPLTVPASGAMAAIYATNDAASGIWRSPAGTSLPVQAVALRPTLNTAELDALNTNHISSIRRFTGTGIVPWGARTLDRTNTDNRFISVVRMREWVAASVERSLAFAAITDNAPPLWSEITTLVEDFLQSLFQQGALVGNTPTQAYFVRCDATTTSAADVAAHRVNVLYGMALLRASEFDITNLSAATYDSLRPVSVPALFPRTLDGQLLLSYPTIAGFNYTLESKTDLQSGVWEGIGGPISGDGAWRRPAIPMIGDRAFYQLRITPAR